MTAPAPQSQPEIARAFALGFTEMLRGEFGRTWDDDQDANEAYDRGGNFAEELFP